MQADNLNNKLNDCKKCLLLEAGEKSIYKTVSDYLANLDSEQKVDGEEYKRRLQLCRECEQLLSGMCRKCGCYVEIRACLADKHCPNVDFKRW